MSGFGGDVTKVQFRGEESARFSRFGVIALSHNLEVRVVAQGREPLTSRVVSIEGVLVDAVLDGYMRHIEVREDGSGIVYWIAGTNATRSIAARNVTFEIDQSQHDLLSQLEARDGVHVPGLVSATGTDGLLWSILDRAPRETDEIMLNAVLNLLSPDNEVEVVREAALDLRAFADFVVKRKSIQRRTESLVLETLPTIIDTDTRIALSEDLGYFGTEASIPTLTTLLENRKEVPYVRWAAAIALGRLPSAAVVDSLLRGVGQPDRSDTSVWIESAVLLGLSRRANHKNRATLEPIFVAALGSEEVIVRRYGCLGLSRFSELDPQTVNQLIELLGDSKLPVSIRGYSALALSNSLEGYDEDSRLRIANVIRSFTEIGTNLVTEPETIWALEFIAELASLLELNDSAALFHAEISDLFSDWRGDYYHALHLYELAESSIRQGEADAALVHFRDASACLANLGDLDPDEQATVTFRRDITEARLELQRIALDWWNSAAGDQAELHDLRERLDDVVRVYRRYSNQGTDKFGNKQLSDREREYLAGAKSLLQVMVLVLKLDAQAREDEILPSAAVGAVTRITEALDELRSKLTSARGPLELANAAYKRFCEVNDVLCNDSIPSENKARALRSLMSELRGLFRKVTWPMPARACPIGGLGAGTLAVLKEDIPGSGTAADPYLFGDPAVINVVATIREMAPGASTRVKVVCQAGAGNRMEEEIHAVEGPTRVTFGLPHVLSEATSTKIDFVLRFETRDCFQESQKLTAYARRQKV